MSDWETYRPSNGIDEDRFMEIVCSKCFSDPETCPILAASYWNYVSDPDYPKEMQSRRKGALYEIRCTGRIGEE